jgi:hypothetical protein
MTKILIFLLPMFFSLFAYGISLEKSVPFKETKCQIGSSKASLFLRFDKKLEPSENDYSGAPMLFLKSKHTVALEPLTDPYPGDFNFIPAKGNSTCNGTQGFQLSKTAIAVLYSKDNRPFQDLFQVAVWDSKADKISDKRELGAVEELFEVKGGFAFSSIIPRSDADQVKMTSATGREMSATDKDLNALEVVTLNGNKLKIEFDPKLSYAKSKWKKFFKDQEDYLKSSGWDAKKKTFKNIVVYEASYFNRKESDILETCIALTDQRGGEFESSGWRCLKEKQ